ncbi:hypothetical protein Tco_1091329 [Tanacetum coccineum]|uniref:Uncharacterized protein n=1 Tax=Tanacetum coccineum TaxID=301880 RepID=A0ABQ5I6W8_9ASTR
MKQAVGLYSEEIVTESGRQQLQLHGQRFRRSHLKNPDLLVSHLERMMDVTPDLSNICTNDNQVHQNAAECVNERDALANLIANLTLDMEENKMILKQLKKANASLTQELEKCKTNLDETNSAWGGLLALKDIEIKEGLKTKAYEISVLNQKHDELVKKSLLTKSQLEGYLKENTKVISDLKVKEEKDIDKMIEMDKQFAEIGRETMTLNNESRSKLDKETVKPYDYTRQNSLYEIFKAPSLEYLYQLERGKEVRNTMLQMDMVHNYYLEKAKKSAQLQKDKEVNGKPSMIDPARLPNTANGCKPKPRNWQASMSSRVSNKDVHLGEHRKQKPFLKLREPKSHNTTKRYVPVEKTSESKKPERLIPKGHRFSHKKTTTVPEKTRSPKSCLRWQPTGRILKTVCLRWVPTGRLFNDCTSKVESKPTHGSNVDIYHIHACKQTLGLSARTSFNGQKQQRIDLNAAALYNEKQENLKVWLLKFLISKKPVPECSSSLGHQCQMMSDHNSSDLAPQRQEMSVENVSSGLAAKTNLSQHGLYCSSRPLLKNNFIQHTVMLRTTTMIKHRMHHFKKLNLSILFVHGYKKLVSLPHVTIDIPDVHSFSSTSHDTMDQKIHH